MTQPLISSSSFISSSKTESNKLLDVLDRTFRFLFLVGMEVFTGAMVVLIGNFAVFTRLFGPITGAFSFFTGDLVSFTFTVELLSLVLTTFHLALLLVFLWEEVFLAEVSVGSLELAKEVILLVELLLLLLLPVEE